MHFIGSSARAFSVASASSLLLALALHGCSCGGETATNCTVTEETDGSATITCPDGTSVVCALPWNWLKKRVIPHAT